MADIRTLEYANCLSRLIQAKPFPEKTKQTSPNFISSTICCAAVSPMSFPFANTKIFPAAFCFAGRDAGMATRSC